MPRRNAQSRWYSLTVTMRSHQCDAARSTREYTPVASGPGLLVEPEQVHRVHDPRHAGERRREASDHSRLRGVRVHDVVRRAAQELRQPAQCREVGHGSDLPPEDVEVHEAEALLTDELLEPGIARQDVDPEAALPGGAGHLEHEHGVAAELRRPDDVEEGGSVHVSSPARPTTPRAGPPRRTACSGAGARREVEGAEPVDGPGQSRLEVHERLPARARAAPGRCPAGGARGRPGAAGTNSIGERDPTRSRTISASSSTVSSRGLPMLTGPGRSECSSRTMPVDEVVDVADRPGLAAVAGDGDRLARSACRMKVGIARPSSGRMRGP